MEYPSGRGPICGRRAFQGLGITRIRVRNIFCAPARSGPAKEREFSAPAHAKPRFRADRSLKRLFPAPRRVGVGGGENELQKGRQRIPWKHSPAKTNRDSGGRRAPRSAAGRGGKACMRLPGARRNAAAARDAAAGPPPASACGRCGSSTRWAESPQGSTARAMQSGRGAARKGTESPEPPGLPRRAPVGRVQDARRGEGRDAGRRGRHFSSDSIDMASGGRARCRAQGQGPGLQAPQVRRAPLRRSRCSPPCVPQGA